MNKKSVERVLKSMIEEKSVIKILKTLEEKEIEAKEDSNKPKVRRKISSRQRIKNPFYN